MEDVEPGVLRFLAAEAHIGLPVHRDCVTRHVTLSVTRRARDALHGHRRFINDRIGTSESNVIRIGSAALLKTFPVFTATQFAPSCLPNCAQLGTASTRAPLGKSVLLIRLRGAYANYLRLSEECLWMKEVT